MVYRKLFGVPAWRVRSPLDELERMRNRMDRLMDGFSGGSFDTATAGVFPLINLAEDKDNYYLYAELPGVTIDVLDIEATQNTISLSGERQIPQEKAGAKYHRKEREAGRFSRILKMPGDINPESVDASLANGILSVVVPKAETEKPKKIVIQGES
jgi:HSP20 family protein